jgi:hypothetical protein
MSRYTQNHILNYIAGEGQFQYIPKRPDPVGANTTLQYSIVGSTALAATYTTFVSSYMQRVAPLYSVSKTALLIRSSARLGLWAGAAGAAINWCYQTAFVGVIASEKHLTLEPGKIYQWTQTRTVEDGLLAGATLGLAASVPTLFMRRPAIPRWTRSLGLTNIGACIGTLGAHGYLQYTGERDKAYRRYKSRLKRRSLEFWNIFWDKELMAQFNPLVQHYIRHIGMWHASNLPIDAYQQLEHDEWSEANDSELHIEAPTQTRQPTEEHGYYKEPYDYAEDLKQFSVESTLAKMEELKAEKQALLREAEFLVIFTVQKQYEYCHIVKMDDDERRRRLQEIHLCEIAYTKVRTAASAIDNRLAKWSLSLQHKAMIEAHPAADDTLDSWLPAFVTIDYKAHVPTVLIEEMEKFQTQIAAEVKQFEDSIAHPAYSVQQKERWRKDLEDGRVLLKAADRIVWELQKARQENIVEPVAKTDVKTVVTDHEKSDRTQLPGTQAAKPTDGSLEPNKP